MPSKKLEIIYHNGQPDGIRSIRKHLSTMTTYVIPRPLLVEAKKLKDANRPGIYYLINENDENKIAQIYIGQTRNGCLLVGKMKKCKGLLYLHSPSASVSKWRPWEVGVFSGIKNFRCAKMETI